MVQAKNAAAYMKCIIAFLLHMHQLGPSLADLTSDLTSIDGC
jgi:hypothetical protein